MQFELFSPNGCSWKTWRESYPQNSKGTNGPTLPVRLFCSMSSENWNEWVIQARGEYSARLKSAQLTNANESLFWPTAAARDWKDSGQLKAVIRKDGKSRLDTLGRVVCQIENGPPDQEKPSTNGKSQESLGLWTTPTAGDTGRKTKYAQGGTALSAQAHMWATPRADKYDAENLETWEKRHKEGKVSQQPLPTQVQNWPTPDTQNHRDGTKRRKAAKGNHAVSLHHKIAETEKNKFLSKLNPNWVEQLMGLPVGWTQLSTAWIGSGSSETELSQTPPQKHFPN